MGNIGDYINLQPPPKLVLNLKLWTTNYIDEELKVTSTNKLGVDVNCNSECSDGKMRECNTVANVYVSNGKVLTDPLEVRYEGNDVHLSSTRASLINGGMDAVGNQDYAITFRQPLGGWGIE